MRSMMKFFLSKKGVLDGFVPTVTTFLVVVLVVAIGASILSTVQTTAGSTNGSIQGGNAAYNITGAGSGGLLQISSYLPIIGLVLVAAIVIGLLMKAFNQ